MIRRCMNIYDYELAPAIHTMQRIQISVIVSNQHLTVYRSQIQQTASAKAVPADNQRRAPHERYHRLRHNSRLPIDGLH